MPANLTPLPSESAAALKAQAIISPADIAAAQALVQSIQERALTGEIARQMKSNTIGTAEVLRNGKVQKVAADVIKPLWTLNGYKWDADTIRFIAPNGRPVALDVVKAASELVTRESQYQLLNDALRVSSGEISTAEWYALGKGHIKHGHAAQGALGNGGWDNLSERALQRLQGRVAFHFEKWQGFGGDVLNGRYGGDIEARSFLQRVNLYADSMRATAENERVEAAKENGHIEGRRVLAATDHCFPANTMVLTSRGEVPIQEIAIGDMVMTRRGLRRVVRLYKNKYEGDLVKVQAGDKEVSCTPNHPFLTDRGWVEAGNLRSGDNAVLLKDRDNFFFSNVSIPKTDNSVSADRQVFIARGVSLLLRGLARVKRFVSRMPVPPFPVSFNNNFVNHYIHDKLRLNSNLGLVFNSQFIKYRPKTFFQFRGLVFLKFGDALKKFLLHLRGDLRTEALSRAGQVRRVMFSHVLCGGIMHQATLCFSGKRDFQGVGSQANSRVWQSQFFGYPLSTARRVVFLNKTFSFGRPFNDNSLSALRAQIGAIVLLPATLRAYRAAHLRVASLAVRHRSNPDVPALRTSFLMPSFILKVHGAAFRAIRILALRAMAAGRTFLRRRVLLRCSGHYVQVYRNVYNLEVEGEHEYIANGFVVHNCDGCVAAAADGWLPIDEVLPIGDADCGVRCHCIIISRRTSAAFVTDDLMDAAAISAAQGI